MAMKGTKCYGMKGKGIVCNGREGTSVHATGGIDRKGHNEIEWTEMEWKGIVWKEENCVER